MELGCDTVQGYLYSRPVGADRLPEVVASLGTQRLQLVPRLAEPDLATV